MTSYTFDIETDGLIPELTHIKCLSMMDNVTQEEYRYTDDGFYSDVYTGELTDVETDRTGNIEDGLTRLTNADEIAGHNIVGFDIPAIQKIYPEFKPKGKIFDTVISSRLMYTDIADRDAISQRKGKYVLDKAYKFRPHCLAAWGIRLGGEKKGDFIPTDFGHTWNEYPFSKECDDYCMQDVRTNRDVYLHMSKRINDGWTEAFELETQVCAILQRQEAHGWLYNVAAAEKLCAELMCEKLELEESLQSVFKPWMARDKEFTPKRNNAKKGYIAGVTITKMKLVSFNPGSRDHIASRLKELYDWHPEKFTPSGKAQVDESVLNELPWPEAKACAAYFTVNKKLAQIGEGKAATLKKVGKDGRMHGRVTHNGAITGRMSHSGPNVAQTDTDPRVRSLYIVPEDKKLLGIDADGIEGRCLAHYLGRFDKGAYTDVILKGSKKLGTDLHSLNRDNVGLSSRNNAKTIFYAWMYGAGDPKLGLTVYNDWPADKQTRFNSLYSGRDRVARLAMLGRKARTALVSGIAGMNKLIRQAKSKATSPGYVKGLDLRRVYTRSQHAALNTLLQSAGAIIMKKALVILDQSLQDAGYVAGVDYEFVGNIHDEMQLEITNVKSDQEKIGKLAEQSIADAGDYYELRCPMSGTYSIGDNWSETH